MKTPLKHGPIRKKGIYRQSAIQTLPTLCARHLKLVRRPPSGRRPGTGLLSKSFRRTEEPPQREARSGGSDMSEDDLESNPVPGRRDP